MVGAPDAVKSQKAEISKGRRGKAEGSYVSFSYGIEPLLKESHLNKGLACSLCIRALLVKSQAKAVD